MMQPILKITAEIRQMDGSIGLRIS